MIPTVEELKKYINTKETDVMLAARLEEWKIVIQKNKKNYKKYNDGEMKKRIINLIRVEIEKQVKIIDRERFEHIGFDKRKKI